MSKVKPKNVWKVAKELINNPHATQREIAKATGISRNTVIKAAEELSQNWTKDETIRFIVDASKERLRKAWVLFDTFLDDAMHEMFDDNKERRTVTILHDNWESTTRRVKMSDKDKTILKDIAKDDLQRLTVLWWDVTDDKWWLKEIRILLPE